MTKFSTFLDVVGDEPFTINRTLKPGTTAIFQSGHWGAVRHGSDDRLPLHQSAYENEGVQIETSAGTAVKMCDPKPLPPPPPLAS